MRYTAIEQQGIVVGDKQGEMGLILQYIGVHIMALSMADIWWIAHNDIVFPYVGWRIEGIALLHSYIGVMTEDILHGNGYGFVGDVDTVDGSRLADLIESGVVPVMAPLTHDGKGNILNTNADTIASETAKALSAYYDVTLVYAFEKAGVLADSDDEGSVIRCLDKEKFEKYVADGTIAGGMLPKLENAFAAIKAGVKRVAITRDTDLEVRCGTMIE